MASATTVSPLIVLIHSNKRVMVPRPTTYEEALDAASRQFVVPYSAIVLQTRELEICQGVLTDISSESWPYVRDELRLVQVANERAVNHGFEALDTSTSRVTETKRKPTVFLGRGRGRGGGSSPSTRSVPTELPPQSDLHAEKSCCDSDSETVEPEINIQVKTLTGKTFDFALSPNDTIDNLLAKIHDREGVPTDQMRLIFAGKQLESARRLRSYNVRNGSIIYQVTVLRGAKPVIYLDAPTGTEVTATVKLSLIPSWRFSAIYPVVPVQENKGRGQTLEWFVTTKSDGTLHEHTVNANVAYLFWEAMTTSSGIMSPPPSPRLNGSSQAYFDPAFANVTRENGVVLSVEKELMSYLDKALTSMGLQVEARTSFITYWLPSFLKHRHVALRFVNQEAYERCAPLEITPALDVVTRVYMVFKGVSEEEAEDWIDDNLDSSRWSSIVGVDEARARDMSLFRVLEWGGMEVF